MLFALQNINYPTRFSELEIRICPSAPLQASQRANIYEEAPNGIAPRQTHLLPILCQVADDGSRTFQGWLGSFFSAQCAYMASI